MIAIVVTSEMVSACELVCEGDFLVNVALAQMPKHGNKKVLIPRLLPWGVPDSVTALTQDCSCSSPAATERLPTSGPLREGPLIVSEGSRALRRVVPEEAEFPRGRADFPLAKRYRRGSIDEAAQIAADPGRLEMAVGNLYKDVYAANSGSTRLSMLSTLNRIADICGRTRGTSRSLLPLTEEKLAPILAALKEAGYRAAIGYITIAHQAHVEAGFDTSEKLARFLEKARASVTRGLGPPVRSGYFDLREILDKVDSVIGVRGGPVLAGKAVTIATWALLREIEAAALKIKNIEFMDDQKVLVIKFGPTKSDPGALGVTRKFGCLCSVGGGEWRPLCPVKLAKEVVRIRLQDMALPEDPLFVDANGEVTVKDGWVSTLQSMFTPCGGVITGHGMRRAGVKLYAGLGMEKWKIQFLARHSSEAIEAYLEEAYADVAAKFPEQALMMKELDSPSIGQLKDIVREVVHDCSGEDVALLKSRGSMQAEAIGKIRGELAKLKEEWVDVVKPNSIQDRAAVIEVLEEQELSSHSVPSEPKYQFVKSVRKDGRTHVVEAHVLKLPHTCWFALCGWQFGLSVAKRGSAADEGYELNVPRPPDEASRCRACFRRLVGLEESDGQGWEADEIALSDDVVAMSAGGMQNTTTSRRKAWDAENSCNTVETDAACDATQTRQLKTTDAFTSDAWLSELGEYLGDSA